MRRALPFFSRAIACLASPARDRDRSARRRPQGARRAAWRAAHRQRRRHHAQRDAAADHREPVGVRSRLDQAAPRDRRRPRRRPARRPGRHRRGAVAEARRARERSAIAGSCRRCRWPIPTATRARSRFTSRRSRASTRTRNSRRAATCGVGSTYQAPDLVVEFRGEASGGEAPDSLTAALRDAGRRWPGPSAGRLSCLRRRLTTSSRWRCHRQRAVAPAPFSAS